MRNQHQSLAMAEIRTSIDFKVGQNSNIPAKIISFNALSSEKEHIALVFEQNTQADSVPLVRLHSECLTGDVFHSSRCDCGEQLDEAILLMAQQGGVIIYLRQEGRGIGLYNKLDAYKHQIAGMDTFQANNHLGFEHDLRDFSEAAEMLWALNIKEVRLLTNNPQKVKALNEAGIGVKKVISTTTFKKEDNLSYLEAKISVAKHQLKLA